MFRPTASLQNLRHRSDLLRATRAFFYDHAYIEVQTPVLSHDIVVDAHLDPFVVHEETTLFLQTSPEFAMKRLLAAGAERIFEITPAFRRSERGSRHNPEFTMAEWYAVGSSYHDQMAFTERLVRHFFKCSPGNSPSTGLASPVFSDEPFERLSYDDAFERFLGTRVLNLNTDELQQLCQSHNVAVPTGALNRDDWLNLLLAECVESNLGMELPVFLYDYPASQSALARVREEASNPPVAERFELYFRGMELCNGYQELTDADELLRRTQQQNELRQQSGLKPLPEQNQLLSAMHSGLPECSGVALGFDRLVMLAIGTEDIADVIPFPIDRA